MDDIPIVFHDIYEYLRIWLENNLFNFSSNTDVSKIVDNVYVGNMSTGTNLSLLKELGITHVLSALYHFNPPYPSEFDYMHISCHDWDFEPISMQFEKSNAFIAAAIEEGGKVYIHCMSGISRSVTLTIAYLLTKNTEMSVSEALHEVKARRTVANPNAGFMKQLEQFKATME
jgi:protein-tyrosine phosphatase